MSQGQPVQRYKLVHNVRTNMGCLYHAIDNPKGEYVLFSDYAALSSREHRMREALQRATECLEGWCKQIDEVGAGWDDWDEYYKDARYGKRDYPDHKQPSVLEVCRAALAQETREGSHD